MVAGSFNRDEAKESKREQLHGLNRMDFGTFCIALSDMANTFYHQDAEAAQRGEAEAL